MSESLARPVAQVGDRLPGGGRVESTPLMLSTDHPENFDVNHMRRGEWPDARR